MHLNFGAYGADVSIDAETGTIKVNEIVFIADVGQIINPIAHQGQIDGGFLMGLGSALTEEIVLEDGRIVNPALSDYKLPTQRDMPPFRVIQLPADRRPGRLRCQGRRRVQHRRRRPRNRQRHRSSLRRPPHRPRPHRPNESTTPSTTSPSPRPPNPTAKRVGTAGWSIPAGMRARFAGPGSQLERYASVFSCVEINSSFYRPHRTTTYDRWARSVPEDFRFSLKLPKTITHERRLSDCENLLAAFLDASSALGVKRDVLLAQLPPTFGFDEKIAERFFAMFRRRDSGASHASRATGRGLRRLPMHYSMRSGSHA